jgi:hypothetical protein
LSAPAVLAARSDAVGSPSILLIWGVLMGAAIAVVALVGAAAWLNNRGNARRAAALEVDVWRSGSVAAGPPDVRVPGGAPVLDTRQVEAPAPRPPSRPQTREECVRLRAEAEELSAVAAAADAAAVRAIAEANQARARFQHIQQAREAAWQAIESAQQAYEAAEQAHQSAQRAAADGADVAPEAEGDVEREVTRAAYGAYRRGDISLDQLQEVLRRASGWDAEREQHEHRVTQLRAREGAARRRYYGFAASERVARKAADVAAVAAQALVDEAAEAIAEAHAARQLAEDCFAKTAGRSAGRGRGARPQR